MLSFFSRQPASINPLINTNISKYIRDTTKKIQDRQLNKGYIIPYKNSFKNPYNYNIIPLISMISFLAGYYLSKI
jgi:hypothetical protein